MVGGLERDQPTGLGGQPLLQAAVPGLTDAFIHNRLPKLGSSLTRVGKGLPCWQREVEFSGNEVGGIEEVVGGPIASGFGLDGLDQGVDAFHEAIA